MPNKWDTRERSAFDIVADLRKHKKANKVAVLGPHDVDASALAEVLPDAIRSAVGDPDFILTGCADVGTEKAARLIAKKLTGERAVVFHRAHMVYGFKKAEQMRDILLAQESTSLVVVGTLNKHARARFRAHGKKVYEVEIE